MVFLPSKYGSYVSCLYLNIISLSECQALSAIPFFQSYFLGVSLVFMLLYVWSREFPTANINIYGLVTLKVSIFICLHVINKNYTRSFSVPILDLRIRGGLLNISNLACFHFYLSIWMAVACLCIMCRLSIYLGLCLLWMLFLVHHLCLIFWESLLDICITF